MTRLRTFLALVAVAALAGPAGAAGQAPQGGTAIPTLEFEKFTLPNGLEVILHVDRKLPVVHVNQWFHVGSKNEKPGRTGFAHLFEHMMFQGSKNAVDEYFTYVEKAGANLREGGVNGTTSNDRTNYFATVPSGNLEQLLWLESDRLATLLEVTDAKKLDNQRDVVKNERRQSYENQPYGRAFLLLFDALFPAGHPYSWPVIGSQEDLTAATLDDVKEFFRQYYAPNNLSLAIAGDFEPARAKELVTKYFGGLPPGPPLDRPARWVPTLDGEKVVEVADRVPQERVYLAWPVPEYFHADEAPLDIAARVLSDGLSSRLDRALVYDRQLATDVSAFNYTLEIAGIFVVQATARPGTPLGEIESIVAAEIARLAKEGPAAAEVERAKTKQESQFISGLEAIGGFGGKADVLNQYNTFLGDPGMIEKDLQRYRQVTPEAVRKAVAQWIDTPRKAVIRFHPEGSQRPATTTLDRSIVPPLGDDRPFTVPAVQTAKLDNGLQIFVVARPDLPKVAVTLATKAGAVGDPKGKAGVAHLAVTTIDMGTTSRNAIEIEEAFGALGTQLTGGAGREGAQIGLDVLSRNLSPALALMADVVRNPTFPENEVAREQKRLLDALSQQERNANALASRVRGILAYGPEHPYGRPAQGLPDTVQTIGRADLAAFHAARWKPGSSALVFSGDVTMAQATALAKEHFGGWTGGAAAEVTIPVASPAPAGRIYLIDRPDAAQTVVSLFLPAPARTTPDYDALVMADAVWGGGGFGTRLNLNLREDKGYSYGVFSNLALQSAAGLWSAGGGVHTPVTAKSLAEFDQELKALAGARPITEAEFDLARSRRVRGYAQQFESLSRINGQIASLWTLGLPMAELQREYEAAGAVTLAAARAAAAKYAKPGAATLLLVGDRAKIESEVRALQLGEIVLVDAEGRTVSEGTGAASPSK